MTIISKCKYPVYYQYVSPTTCKSPDICPTYTWNPVTTAPNTWAWDVPPYTGISLKFSKQNVNSPYPPVTQIEYTCNPSIGTIWFDTSSLNGAPFADDGLKTAPSTGPTRLFPTCTGANCAPGGACTNVYVEGSPDYGMSCPDSTSVTFVACSG